MTNLTSFTLQSAYKIADSFKHQLSSNNDDLQDIGVVESLAQSVIPLFEKNHKIVLPSRANKNQLIRDCASHYPVLKPFLEILFPQMTWNPRETQVIVRCNAGWGHKLYIRGDGGGLDWKEGIEMQSIGEDLWSWKTIEKNFNYKILFDDDSENGWEDFESNRFKKGQKDEVIAPTFSHFNKNGDDLPQDELATLNKIYAAQAAIEKATRLIAYTSKKDQRHDDFNERIIHQLKKIMLALCPDNSPLPSEDISARAYAMQCVQLYPFTTIFILQLFPSLPIEQIIHLHLQKMSDPLHFTDQMRILWESIKPPQIDIAIELCVNQIDEIFPCAKKRKFVYQALAKTLEQMGYLERLIDLIKDLKGTNPLLAIETAKVEMTQDKNQELFRNTFYQITDTQALFEIFLLAITHSKLTIRNFIEHKFVIDIESPVFQACKWGSSKLDCLTAFDTEDSQEFLSMLCKSKRWKEYQPLLEKILKNTDPFNEEVTLLWLAHFLGLCEQEGISPDQFSPLLENLLTEATLQWSSENRYLLTDQIIAALKDPSSKINPQSHVLTQLLISRLISCGLPEKNAQKIYECIEHRKFTNFKDRQPLLDLFLKLIDCAPFKNEKEIELITQCLTRLLVSPDMKFLGSELEALTNICSFFGKEAFLRCLEQEKNYENFLLTQFHALFEIKYKKTFNEMYRVFFNNLEEKKALNRYLKRILKLPQEQRTEALNSLLALTLTISTSPYPKKPSCTDLLDPEVIKMVADIFSNEGFTEDPAKDLNREKRLYQTIGEVQGNSIFCKKIVEYGQKNPAILSPQYLRNLDRLNHTSLTLRFKRIGHVLNQEGAVVFSDENFMELEGANETFMMIMLRKMFEEFAAHEKGRISKETIDFVTESLSKAIWNDNLSNEKIDEIHKLIHDPSYLYPVVVGSGWDWHSTQVIFYRHQGKMYMLHCNRGADCGEKPGISIFHVKEEKNITPEFLNRIAARLSVKHSEYTSLDKIQTELDAVPIDFMRMKAQKVGNCTLTSLKAAIYALLIIAELKNNEPIFPHRDPKRISVVQAFYKIFNQFDTETILEDFLMDLDEISIEMLLSGKYKRYKEGVVKIADLLKKWSEAKKDRPQKASAEFLKKIETKLAEFNNKIELADILSNNS